MINTEHAMMFAGLFGRLPQNYNRSTNVALAGNVSYMASWGLKCATLSSYTEVN